ncbi:ScbR family autoregulator-binding transcription factor [Amycolatopsis magusensis]|uniref:ScbR family autoregulator-binding transcription factor n=1 Tax=Amycolatopsis magusensis TaxID=882444 RepID=UPI003C2FFFA8
MPKQERAELTRTAILDAAAMVFDERGFQGGTLTDIIAGAGVTKGALYFHFSSKEEIAKAIISEQFTIWTPPDDPDLVTLQTAIDLSHGMGLSLQNNPRVRAGIRLVIEQGTFSTPTPDAYKNWIGLVQTCLESAARQGDLRPDLDPNEVATFIIASFTGVQISSEVLTQREDISERLTTMWRLTLPGIVPPRRLHKFRPEGSNFAEPGAQPDIEPEPEPANGVSRS